MLSIYSFFGFSYSDININIGATLMLFEGSLLESDAIGYHGYTGDYRIFFCFLFFYIFTCTSTLLIVC